MLLKLKDDSQNTQFENTTIVMIGLKMHGPTKLFLYKFQAWHDYCPFSA